MGQKWTLCHRVITPQTMIIRFNGQCFVAKELLYRQFCIYKCGRWLFDKNLFRSSAWDRFEAAQLLLGGILTLRHYLGPFCFLWSQKFRIEAFNVWRTLLFEVIIIGRYDAMCVIDLSWPHERNWSSSMVQMWKASNFKAFGQQNAMRKSFLIIAHFPTIFFPFDDLL